MTGVFPTHQKILSRAPAFSQLIEGEEEPRGFAVLVVQRPGGENHFTSLMLSRELSKEILKAACGRHGGGDQGRMPSYSGALGVSVVSEFLGWSWRSRPRDQPEPLDAYLAVFGIDVVFIEEPFNEFDEEKGGNRGKTGGGRAVGPGRFTLMTERRRHRRSR